MKYFKPVVFLFFSLFLFGCIGNMNPTGGNSSPDYPFFVTTQAMVVKKIAVPVGTTLTYEEKFLTKGQQTKALDEDKLTEITFAEGKPYMWGGVPITSISRFFNTEMRGYSVAADFDKLPDDKKTKFSELWNSCNDVLGIAVKNLDDWSFNKLNIENTEGCGVNNQRYFKEDAEQQAFLDRLLAALLATETK